MFIYIYILVIKSFSRNVVDNGTWWSCNGKMINMVDLMFVHATLLSPASGTRISVSHMHACHRYQSRLNSSSYLNRLCTMRHSDVPSFLSWGWISNPDFSSSPWMSALKRGSLCWQQNWTKNPQITWKQHDIQYSYYSLTGSHIQAFYWYQDW